MSDLGRSDVVERDFVSALLVVLLSRLQLEFEFTERPLQLAVSVVHLHVVLLQLLLVADHLLLLLLPAPPLALERSGPVGPVLALVRELGLEPLALMPGGAQILAPVARGLLQPAQLLSEELALALAALQLVLADLQLQRPRV
ncbi:hypothetical protein R3I93_018312 [Phoxinus phoxinus]|uniref:Uncharacterized protein n=1 Tax=Phoxinus phoxinus TaxID=58324 RepID=A0AAN9CG88_9TELE